MDAVYNTLYMINQIPAVVWAAVIASLLTLVSVFFTNRNARIQQLASLKHDAAQRDREREMSLRREVYLRVAEAISKSQNLLVRLPDLNISDQELNAEFRQDSAFIAKIQVVGTNATVQAVSMLLQKLATAYMELSLQRFRLIERKNKITLMTNFIDKSLKEVDRYIELMKQLNLGGNADPRVWQVVTDNLEFERKRQEGYDNQKQQLLREQKNELLQFTKLCIERFIGVSQYIPPAVFAVREELELALDKEAYLKMFNENTEKGKAVFDSFLADIGKLLNIDEH